MYQATITTQRQMTLPAKLMELVGISPGEKVDLIASGTNGGRVIMLRRSSGWEDMRGILRKYTKVRRYPTKEEMEEGWVVGYRNKWLKNAKSTR